MSKRLLLISLFMTGLVVSMLLAPLCSAASVPKPSIPDFTLKVVAHPYDVPPKYETNSYTGKNEMTEAGYHAENKSIEVTIRNQPFISTSDENGNYANLYYAVRFKGRYTDEWKYYPHNMDSNYNTEPSTPFNASESEYTTITVGLATYLLNNVPAGGEVDFQVEAFIGYEKRVTFFFLGDEGHYYTFTAFERSGWSETQTITIPTPSSSAPSSSSSPISPSVPEFTVQFVDNSYDVPATYTIDPYTGQQIANPGYHVQNKCIVVKIKNQPFESFKNEYEDTINLFYNIRIKGHFEENWTVLYRPVYGIPKQSTDSNYTVFSYTWNEHGDTWIGSWAVTLRYGAQVDFQVQAMIGRIVDHGPFSTHSPREDFEGETSGWSNTQTITVGESVSTVISTEPTPKENSQKLQFEVTIELFPTVPVEVVTIVAVVVVAGLIIYLKKRGGGQPA